MILVRDVQRVLLSVLLGPLVGCVSFLTTAVLYEFWVLQSARTLLGEFDIFLAWPPLLLFAYVLGSIPALLSGIAGSIIAHHTPRRGRRIAYSAVAGAIASAGTLWVLILNGEASVVPPHVFVSVVGISGATASLLCTLLIERFGSRRGLPDAPPAR